MASGVPASTGFLESSVTRWGAVRGDDGPAPGDEIPFEGRLRGESFELRGDLSDETDSSSDKRETEVEAGIGTLCLSFRKNKAAVVVFGLSGRSKELRIGLGGHDGLPIDRGAVDGPSGGGGDALVGCGSDCDVGLGVASPPPNKRRIPFIWARLSECEVMGTGYNDSKPSIHCERGRSSQLRVWPKRDCWFVLRVKPRLI